MIQEDKSLLLKDLCARLPYGVKCVAATTNNESNTIGGYCEVFDDFYIREVDGWFNISIIKPYLRPMSSMTKEEEEELRFLKNQLVDCDENNEIKFDNIIDEIHKLYLLNHIDFMGLIPKGLAIEVNEGNNPYKN